MKYLKKFEDHDGYEEFKESSNFVIPSLSVCVEESHLHYDGERIEPLVISYSADSVTSYTLYTYSEEVGGGIIGADVFDKIKVDDVEVDVASLDANYGVYDFSTNNVHVVKFWLKDNTRIADAAFPGNQNMLSVVIPNTVTTIGEYAFNSCTNIAEVVFPEGVTTIRESSFYSVYRLNSIVLPSTVTSIGEHAFHDCVDVSYAVIYAVNPPTLGGIGEFASYNDYPIYVPDESVNAYKAAEYWTQYASRIFGISEMPQS